MNTETKNNTRQTNSPERGPHSTIVFVRLLNRLCGLFRAATLAADLGLGTLAMGPEWTGDSGSTGQAGDSCSA